MYAEVLYTVTLKFKGDISRLLSMMILPKKLLMPFLIQQQQIKLEMERSLKIPLEEAYRIRIGEK